MFRKLQSKITTKKGDMNSGKEQATAPADDATSLTSSASTQVLTPAQDSLVTKFPIGTGRWQRPPNFLEARSLRLQQRSEAVADRFKSNQGQTSVNHDDAAVEDTSLMPLLQYKPLADKNIRVLTIIPGQQPAPVVVSLEQCEISANANYNALSYTWGDESMKRGISCLSEEDQQQQSLYRLYITQSCFKALHRLRHPTKPRRFWIDSICINQEDIKERNTQVQQMGEIYKYAQVVHIYLVEEDMPKGIRTGSEEAIEIFKGFAEGSRSSLDRLTTADRASIMKLVGRSWFTRAWIMQEVFNATDPKKTRLICGEHELLFHNLHNMAWGRRLKSDRFPDAAPTWPGVFRVQDYESYRFGTKEFVRLLAFTKGCKATDPRDKVYALLPMLENWDKAALPVEYGIDVEDLYVRFAKQLVSQSPAMLAIVDHQTGSGLEQFETYFRQPQHEKTEKFIFPSWVPDLRQEENGVPIWPTPVGGWQEEALDYCSGGENSGIKSDILVLPQKGQLALKMGGIQIGRIAIIDPEVMYTSLLDLIITEHSHFRKSWARMRMAWEMDSKVILSVEQLNDIVASMSVPLETFMDAINFTGDAEEEPGTRDPEAHPLKNSINDALLWPKWKHIRKVVEAHHLNDMLGMDDAQPNGLFNYVTKRSYHHDPFSEEMDQELAFDVVNLINGRKIFVSDDGWRMGLAPPAARVGDVLCIMYGVPIPLLIRPLNEAVTGPQVKDIKYLLLGGCYVNGLMQQDAINKLQRRKDQVDSNGATENKECIFTLI